MSIELECTGCRRNLRVKDEMAGRKVRCPGCGKVMTVPALVEELPVVEGVEKPPEAEEEQSPAAPSRRRRRKARRPSEGGGVPGWLAPVGLSLLLFALGTGCLILAINTGYTMLVVASIFFWILGVFNIMRMFGWSPYQ
jgi:hypothetical protein